MLKNLLHPKWQHTDAAMRRRAIEEDRLDADILFELAKTDPDTGVRALAVSQMQDIQQLIAVAECSPDGADTGVPARLHDLILAADPQIEPDIQTLQRCNELCSAEQHRQSLLLHAPYAALRQMAAEGVHQDETLEQCVLNDSAREVRRAAVLRIENEETLRHIAKQLRGHDKTTARLADEKRAQLQQQRDRVEQRRELLSELQAFAEVAKPLDEAVIGKHTRQWENIADDADGEDQERFDALLAVLQPKLEQHRRQLQKEREGRSLREETIADAGGTGGKRAAGSGRIGSAPDDSRGPLARTRVDAKHGGATRLRAGFSTGRTACPRHYQATPSTG